MCARHIEHSQCWPSCERPTSSPCKFVPASCTGELQPLDSDGGLNNALKKDLTKSFMTYYVGSIAKEIAEDCLDNAKVDLRLSKMKPLHARWLLSAMDKLSPERELIMRDWERTGIKAAVEKAPVADLRRSWASEQVLNTRDALFRASDQRGLQYPTSLRVRQKAWMTAAIFKEWVRKIDGEMGRRRKKIVLLLDNCTAHPHDISRDNIRLVFPPTQTPHTVAAPEDTMQEEFDAFVDAVEECIGDPTDEELCQEIDLLPANCGTMVPADTTKFVWYKDRELVRGAAKNLKGTSFGISDDYPMQIRQVSSCLECGLEPATIICYGTAVVVGKT
ncbi:TIGD6 [Branchiostoma lanceolatum]|uniref:TIGD6 protein n=1 Tax=Branchiostoma lanceolatum TaxID=7740 RepID=A0A8K0EHF2_BRALA|nr:TIGD6 [Branchiostoma lanceolatum]